jgi:hypothetical protein
LTDFVPDDLPDEYREFRTRADKELAAGDLPAAFREHCRAMHVLLRSLNARRHKEEIFQPVWDKYIGETGESEPD